MLRVTGQVGIRTRITGTVAISTSGMPMYPGPYEVTPRAYADQVLSTNHMGMSQDLTVKEIPYSEVSNPQGGYTINIGGD